MILAQPEPSPWRTGRLPRPRQSLSGGTPGPGRATPQASRASEMGPQGIDERTQTRILLVLL
eukprot:2048469-Rhodomonas_salina.2